MKPVSARMKRDPTAAEPLMRKYEKRILALFEDYREEAARILRTEATFLPLQEKAAVKSPYPLMPPSPPKIKTLIDTKKVQAHLDQAGLVKVNIPGDLIIDEETEKAYRHGMEYGNRQIKSVGGGIALGIGPKDLEMIKALKGRSLADLKGITDATSAQIMRVITDGIINDQEFGEITRDIVRSVDKIGIVRAANMVRTETMKAVNIGVYTRYERAGLSEEDEEWLTALDNDTCDACRENNGKTIAEIGYYPPGHGSPDVPYGCRCTIIPKIKVPVVEAKRGTVLDRIADYLQEVAKAIWHKPRITISPGEPDGAMEGDIWVQV
jgi:SPP1 gp7 family putative phage head morphogenesis protein